MAKYCFASKNTSYNVQFTGMGYRWKVIANNCLMGRMIMLAWL